MTRFYIDTEFIEDGKTIDLISIGIVREDGRELYLQSVEFDPVKASGWVRENVLSHLKVCHVSGKWNLDQSLYSWERCKKPDCPWRTRLQIAHEIFSFINNIPDLPEFYGDYCAYDYVALCQLFGTMMDWPHNWPMYFHDLRQQAHFANMVDISLRVPMAETEHNALSDARWVKKAWEFLS